MRTDTYKR